MAHEPDGFFLSNGPGDPAATGEYAVPVIQQMLETKKPLFGICLGHQMLALAVGGKTSKMFQGHRGANHPVKRLADGRVEITSMNHGFAVEREGMPDNVRETHVSLFDGSNCGIELTDRPAFSVQYHPEASPGPQDSFYLFEKFVGSDAVRSTAAVTGRRSAKRSHRRTVGDEAWRTCLVVCGASKNRRTSPADDLANLASTQSQDGCRRWLRIYAKTAPCRLNADDILRVSPRWTSTHRGRAAQHVIVDHIELWSCSAGSRHVRSLFSLIEGRRVMRHAVDICDRSGRTRSPSPPARRRRGCMTRRSSTASRSAAGWRWAS